MLRLRPLPEDQIPAREQLVLEHASARRVRNSFEDPQQAQTVARGVLERSAEHLRHFDVLDDEAVVGWLAWWSKDDQAEVTYLVLDEPARSPELLPALIGLATEGGATSLGVAAVPGEPAKDPLAASEGFVPRATNMVLPLDGVIGDPAPVELRPMTQTEFDDFLAGSNESYAGELEAAGMSHESARAQAAQQMAELIPAGLDSDGQRFFTAWVDESAVGTLWLSTERPMAFVYDIEVRPSERRKGYGESIMDAGARWCRDLGHPALGLNVFAHNPRARALYDKLGYRVTADFRTLDLPDAG